MLASGRGGGGEGRGEEAVAMGNKMCVSRGRAVAERLTRPQRLIRQPSDVDYKKLRKLILAQKLAPCFDAVDDPQLAAGDLEECPICFLYYPSLNRSRCCAKGICTECFLQMKPSHTSRPAQCPFCKSSCYAVEYHGARTEEEKSLEEAEEQKVIEAKIRMQSESLIEESLVPANQSQTLLELLHPFPDVEGPSSEGEEREISQLQMSSQQETINGDGSSYPNMCPTRHEEVDVDLEEIMVMEAIWLSLQDSRSQRSESSEMGSRSYRENPARTLPSCDQGESCSTAALTEDVASAIARLADHDVLRQKVLELNRGMSQTDRRNSCENFVLESNSMQPEGGCPSGSGLSISEQSFILTAKLNTA